MTNDGGPTRQNGLVDASAGDALTFAETCHAARLQAGRNILRAAYQWAVLHSPDRLPEPDRRGRERAKPAGAEGTPLITEYAAATFGARIQTSPYGAKKLIADAVDLHHRLPRLNAGISAGTVQVSHARHVAEATRELSPEEAAWVDAEVAEVAQVKEESAAKDRYVRMSRVNRHGIATLTIRDHAATPVVEVRGALGAEPRNLRPRCRNPATVTTQHRGRRFRGSAAGGLAPQPPRPDGGPRPRHQDLGP